MSATTGEADFSAVGVDWLVRTGKQTGSTEAPHALAELERRGLDREGHESAVYVTSKLVVDEHTTGLKATRADTSEFIRWCQKRRKRFPEWFPHMTAIPINDDGSKGPIVSKAFEPNARGDVDWDALARWMNERQGKANIYYALNSVKLGTRRKAGRADIVRVLSFHVDIDPRVGESPEDCKKRALKMAAEYRVPPTDIMDSGGGVQLIWDILEPIIINGDIDAAEDAKLYNIQLERDFDGDQCHNIDRILRAFDTWNIPDARKLKKGRQRALARRIGGTGEAYPLSAFTKAKPAAPNGEGQGTPKKSRGEHTAIYVGTGTADDSTPILSLEDTRLSAMDKWCKEYARTMTLPDEAPTNLKAQIGNAGFWDFKIASELVRIGCTDAQIKQVWKAGKIGADANQWPRGFDGDMDRLIERAREASKDADVEAMNAKHCVINIAGKTRILTWRASALHPGRLEFVLSTVDDFKFLHRRRHKVIMVKERDEHGNETGDLKPKRVSLVDHWLRHPHCSQYDDGMAFMPFTDARNVKGKLNTWTGFAFETKSGDWSLFKAHILDNLCAGNRENYEYLIRWMAFIIQKRKPTHVVMLLRSEEEGTGKGFWANHFGKLFGLAFMQVTNPDHVIGKFNPHLENLLLLNADEALFAGDPRHRNALWSLTTEPTITIEPKGFAVYKAPNYLNFIITTNADEAVRVTRTARRIFALDVAAHQVGHPEYFDAIEEQLNAGGYEAMLHDLQTMDLAGFDVRKSPKTEALRKQIAHGRHGVERLVEEACSTGIVPCPSHRLPGYTLVGDYEDRRGFDWFIANHPDSELKRLGALRVKLALKKWGCAIGQGARKHERANGPVVRGIEWPVLSELRARFVELYGPQEWESPNATDWLLPTSEGPGTPDEGQGGSNDLPF